MFYDGALHKQSTSLSRYIANHPHGTRHAIITLNFETCSGTLYDFDCSDERLHTGTPDMHCTLKSKTDLRSVQSSRNVQETAIKIMSGTRNTGLRALQNGRNGITDSITHIHREYIKNNRGHYNKWVLQGPSDFRYILNK